MKRPWRWPLVVMLGAVLVLWATIHHWTELTRVHSSLGPVLAFLVDGVPALGLIYGGYALSQLDLPPAERRFAVAWTLIGGALFGIVVGVTFAIKGYEGRPIIEPTFSLLVAVEAGALAGLVAGTYGGRARANTRRARRAQSALEVVNSLIRHDLQNDLNTIRGYAELAECNTADQAHTTVIIRKADEASTRIENAGAIGRTVTGDATTEMVDLVPIVEEVAANTEQAFSGTIHTDLPSAAAVAANQAVRSIVDNLLENAVEHSDGGTVTVTVETDSERVRLRVRDDGIGIPDRDQETLFEYRDDSTGGGGLYLTKTLVEAFNGDIRVEANDDGGATFVVELPGAAQS